MNPNLLITNYCTLEYYDCITKVSNYFSFKVPKILLSLGNINIIYGKLWWWNFWLGMIYLMTLGCESNIDFMFFDMDDSVDKT
jgi:hypothetical protein